MVPPHLDCFLPDSRPPSDNDYSQLYGRPLCWCGELHVATPSISSAGPGQSTPFSFVLLLLL